MNHISIPPLDHFIEVEVVPGHLHVSQNGNVASKPNIGLLADGCVKSPLAVALYELGKGRRIAVLLAEHVTFFMLRTEVKYIDRLSRLIEVMIPNIILMSGELAV